MKKETLKGKADYDDKYDILILKVANRDYRRSLEMEDLFLDLDKQNRISGIRIFDASEFLDLSKEALSKIPHWELRASVNEGEIRVCIRFQVKQKDKVVETKPVIVQSLSDPLPDSELVCSTA